MIRLIAGLDITERLGNRRAIVSSVKGGKLYSTIYGIEYTPELLAQCVAVKPELNYWKLMPNGRTEQVYYATQSKAKQCR